MWCFSCYVVVYQVLRPMKKLSAQWSKYNVKFFCCYSNWLTNWAGKTILEGKVRIPFSFIPSTHSKALDVRHCIGEAWGESICPISRGGGDRLCPLQIFILIPNRSWNISPPIRPLCIAESLEASEVFIILRSETLESLEVNPLAKLLIGVVACKWWFEEPRDKANQPCLISSSRAKWPFFALRAAEIFFIRSTEFYKKNS